MLEVAGELQRMVNSCKEQYSRKTAHDLAVSPEHHLDTDIDAGRNMLARVDDDLNASGSLRHVRISALNMDDTTELRMEDVLGVWSKRHLDGWIYCRQPGRAFCCE